MYETGIARRDQAEDRNMRTVRIEMVYKGWLVQEDVSKVNTYINKNP